MSVNNSSDELTRLRVVVDATSLHQLTNTSVTWWRQMSARTWCLFSASFLVNVLPQPPLHTNGFSPVCVSRCRFRSCCLLKDNAHMSQEKGR
ncbi:hypothetical protein SCP_0308280 [Sparassis crispa]|uniref:Uncharacterized protein n=1 Tax=Sparassis crispa TaxID=139825 RepID=A0A401GG71_9APHY|nr:hypothetical protein SCP_0308280 [Sparassis crispa]GBE81103.1 hypothetical protein SCP_0308280 [Sparassis crispa]